MPNLKTLNLDGTPGTEFILETSLLIEKPAKQAMFDAVISENASVRQGTHSTLTKAEVRGGGKKPWMQKHTGRARQGSTRNPHWVKGGVAFGPKPNRNYIVRQPREVGRLAFKSAFTTQLENIFILGNIESVSTPKTKNMVKFLAQNNLHNKKTLLVIDSLNENLILSSANLPMVYVKHWDQVSTKDLLNASAIVIEQNAIRHLETKVG